MADHALDEGDVAEAAPPGGTRERIKAFIASRYSTRVHMSLILASCGLTAMISSATLLHYGVHSMLLRYPVSMSLAYVTFLLGVWTWLRATGLLAGATLLAASQAQDAKRSRGRWLDLPSGSGGSSGGGGGGSGGASIPRGGGGTFDGGGASGSFAEARAPAVGAVMTQPDAAGAEATRHAASPSSSSSSSGSKSGFSLGGIDGDGIVMLLLAGLLILVVFCTSGYLIWCAPDVLTEAVFGAALTGTLSRASTNHAAGGWVGGVVRKTWWPFALVLLAALAFAGWSATHYPAAHTFSQAITAALHSHSS